MAPLVRDFCARNGLPYRIFGWGEALWKSWAVLRHVATTTPKLEAARVPTTAP
jgi:hypothetical protein